MIYCSLEPGLFTLEGLQPYETAKAFSVVRSLRVHKKMLSEARAGGQIKVPVTIPFLERVLAALNNIPIKNPPLSSAVREYITEILANQTQPALTPTGMMDTQVTPDIVSDWIGDDLRALWLDCISATLFETFLPDEKQLLVEDKLVLATWPRDGLPLEVALSSDQLAEWLSVRNGAWIVPLLVHEHDWRAVICSFSDWPNGLDSLLIESYARRYLGIKLENLSQRRHVMFEKPCLRAITKEPDLKIRQGIVEIIACRAYNCPKPEHHDETIEQLGMRRVRVRKMDPPVRLHYYLDENDVVYTLYTNGDHDRGL